MDRVDRHRSSQRGYSACENRRAEKKFHGGDLPAPPVARLLARNKCKPDANFSCAAEANACDEKTQIYIVLTGIESTIGTEGKGSTVSEWRVKLSEMLVQMGLQGAMALTRAFRVARNSKRARRSHSGD